jgi:putative hydrolase of the HAD superfamily
MAPVRVRGDNDQERVFDVGNVFVRWSPEEVVERCFGIPRGGAENERRAHEIFRSPIWLAVNRGELTRAAAEQAYCADHALTASESSALFFHAMDHQVPILGTEELARLLKDAGYRIFGLTDNVREIVAHSKERYAFWKLFEGVIVSAEVGVLKPDEKIFKHLLRSFDLEAEETVFLDDTLRNVEGARRVGFAALQFSGPEVCERDLRALDLSF